jgi:hypothetical protein
MASYQRSQRARTPAGVLARRLRDGAALARAGAYPLAQYQNDPVRYAVERLRVVLMPHQIEILRALSLGITGGSLPNGRKAPPRVAVRSGQKCGKTLVAICACLWFYECFADARVFLCAAIQEQTKLVLWRELASVLRHAKKSGVDIDGKASASPSGGFISTDGSREIRGLSGRDIESLAGLSGAQLMVVDEASALPEKKSQVFEGNQMGGGTSGILMISNPTRTDGPFYDAFHGEAEYWQTFHVDSEEVANWQHRTGRRIPYTVTREKIEEARERYGETSPFWLLRIKGEFLRNEAGRCIPMIMIDDAIERWRLAADTGPLVIGYDVAGAAAGGDLHAWAPVRGKKCGGIHTREGLSIGAALQETYSLLKIHRRHGEVPHVHVDAEGPIGSVVYARLHDEAEHRSLRDKSNTFEVVAIRSSSRTVRQASKFERQRDEMIWNLAQWMIDGAIPPDDKLEAELHAPRWSAMSDNRMKATAKDDLRDILNRSPDRFDALCLAVQPSPDWMHEDEDPRGNVARPIDAYDNGARDHLVYAPDPDEDGDGDAADLVYGGSGGGVYGGGGGAYGR